MSLTDRQQHVLAELTAQGDGQRRLVWLVERSHRQARLPEPLKTEAHRVPGCLSQLWLVADWPEGRSRFRCDSDSQIVRAVAGFLCEFYSDLSPEELLAAELAPLEQAGLHRQLTPNRRNAMSRVWERLRASAEAALANGPA